MEVRFPLGGDWVPLNVLVVGVGASEDEIESLPPPVECLDCPRPNTHPGSPAFPPLDADPPRIILAADRPNE